MSNTKHPIPRRQAGCGGPKVARLIALAVACCCLAISGCDQDSIDPFVDDDATIEIVSGNGQAALAGQGLAAPLLVRVRDRDANPLEGVDVRFSVTAGDGFLTGTSVEPTGVATILSDWDGRAQVYLTLGPTGGDHAVEVDLPQLPEVSPLTFVAQASLSSPDVTVHILDPDANQLVEDEVLVEVVVRSTHSIASVAATIGPITVPLAFRENVWPDGSRYRSAVSLADFPGGTFTLRVTATDVLGNQTAAFQQVILDKKPGLVVLTPINHSVARPTINAHIVCSDEPSGCAELRVTHSDAIVVQTATEFVGTLQLTGPGTRFIVRAKDSSGQLIEKGLTIYVEPNQKLREIADAPGVVLDVVGPQVLFIDSTTSPARVLLRTLGANSSSDVVVMTQPTGSIDLYQSFSWGRIIPGGAIVATLGDWRLNRKWLYVSWNGTLSTFTGASALSVTVAGNWIAYERDGGLYRRNLLTGVEELIPNALSGSIVEDGRVFYQPISPGPIGVYGGTNLPVSGSTPRSDGTIVVYGSGSYGIRMFDGTTEIVLAPANTQYVVPDRHYAVNNGWVAFLRADGVNRHQVWTRSPTGTLRQVTSFGTDARIEALGSDGTVFVSNGSRRFRATALGALEDIVSLAPTIVWRQSHFVVLVGRMAYTVD